MCTDYVDLRDQTDQRAVFLQKKTTSFVSGFCINVALNVQSVI